MDTPNQRKEDATQPAVEPPANLVAEGKAAFAPTDEKKPTTGAAAKTEGLSAVPNEPSAESFAFHVHKYIGDHIRFADQKAAFFFAASGGLLCYLFKEGAHEMWLKSPCTWTVLDFLCLMAMGLLAIGLVLSCWVVIPILRKTHRGLVFFNSIAEFESSTAYASEILSATSVALSRAVLQHDYDLSLVCRDKYRKLAFAIWFASAGVLLTILVLLLRG